MEKILCFSIIFCVFIKSFNCQIISTQNPYENLTAIWDTTYWTTFKDSLTDPNESHELVKCWFTVEKTIESCATDSCKTWQIDFENIYSIPYPSTKKECCAVWATFACVKRSVQLNCESPGNDTFLNYWLIVKKQYENDCETYPDFTADVCNLGISLSHPNILAFIAFILIFPIILY